MESKDISRERKVIIKDYNLKELAQIYCVGIKKMRNMLNQIRSKVGWPLGRSYTVRQVEIIFNLYTPPYSVYMHDLNEEEFEKKMRPIIENAPLPAERTKTPPAKKKKAAVNKNKKSVKTNTLQKKKKIAGKKVKRTRKK